MNTLRQSVEDYLGMRRNLGFKLIEVGNALPKFVTFMEQRNALIITQSDALEWAQLPQNVQPAHWAARLSYVRGFARYRSSIDPRTQIPASGLLPFQTKRSRPYLYSDEEINQLLSAALNMPQYSESCALLPRVYYCLLGLLCVTGLRLGEARNLTLQDVDLDAELITVRNAKFGKDRLVPLHSSTCEVLTDYLVRRQAHWGERAVSDYLFVSSWGNRLDSGQIYRAFHKISRQIGLRGPNDSKGPRLHDLRHRFSTNTLVNWYKNEQDPERLLPILSAYLGHVKVADTQWYLEASPELMSEAMKRLEKRWEDHS